MTSTWCGSSRPSQSERCARRWPSYYAIPISVSHWSESSPGMRRIRGGRLRIAYRVSAVAPEIVAIGPRRTIYAELEVEARRTDAPR
jgi:hypothetical protein